MDIEEIYNNFSTIVNNHNQEIIQLYVEERQRIGNGCLFIDTTPIKNNKINMTYIPMEKIPDKIKNDLTEKYNANPKESIMYFYIFDSENSLLYELDLDNNNL